MSNLIPKRIYFFWENDKMSWMRYMTLFSFRKFNPDWEVILYLNTIPGRKDRTWRSSEEQDFHAYTGEDTLERLDQLDIKVKLWEGEMAGIPGLTPNVRSDVFRWEQLAKTSGFYSDMDILWIKPMNSLYKKIKNGYDAVLCYRLKYFSIGLVGSSGRGNFFRDVSQCSVKTVRRGSYQSGGVEALYKWLRTVSGTGPQKVRATKFWEILHKNYPDMSFYNTSMSLIYPWISTQMGQVFRRKHVSVPEDCIGIHWYAGAGVSQKFNNLLSEDTFREYENTFSVFAERVLE